MCDNAIAREKKIHFSSCLAKKQTNAFAIQTTVQSVRVCYLRCACVFVPLLVNRKRWFLSTSLHHNFAPFSPHICGVYYFVYNFPIFTFSFNAIIGVLSFMGSQIVSKFFRFIHAFWYHFAKAYCVLIGSKGVFHMHNLRSAHIFFNYALFFWLHRIVYEALVSESKDFLKRHTSTSKTDFGRWDSFLSEDCTYKTTKHKPNLARMDRKISAEEATILSCDGPKVRTQ